MKALTILDLPNYSIGNDEKRSGLFRIRALETMFEAITTVNMAWMLANKPPKLYASGVRYRKDPVRGDVGEVWCDAPTILQRGYDDCEGLASFLAAEMRLGPNSETETAVPTACVRLKTTRFPGLLHAIVFDPATNRIFDPSRRLGMGKHSEF